MSAAGETPAATPASSRSDAASPARSMVGTLRVVGSLVAPTTLVVALLYYFGWTRTSTQAFVMGLDDSLFGFTAQDYILRSITSMFWPLFVAAAAILLAAIAHARFLARPSDELVRKVSARVAIGGAVLLALGTLGSALNPPSRFVSVAAPLAITVGFALLGYAAYVRGLGAGRLRRRGRAAERPGERLAWGLVTVLLLLSAFWTVSHYAAIKGIDFARKAVEQLPLRPSVTIYSASRLHLEEPVVEEALPGSEGAYRFRYTGLKLLFRADDKLFLRPSDPNEPRNIVIPEDIGIRVEYAPPTS